MIMMMTTTTTTMTTMMMMMMIPMRIQLICATIMVIVHYRNDKNAAFGMLTNSVNRCDAAPCNCDAYARLICDCNHDPEELLLTTEGDRRLSPRTTRIQIINCPTVILANSSLTAMGGLRGIRIENVANLTIYPKSFELSTRETPAKISVTNTSIDLLPSFAFKGDVNEIYLRNVRIGKMNAFAFSNLVGTETVTLENCSIESMEAQSFKKFDVGYLHVIGGSFGSVVPSRAMNDIEVANKFMLDGVRMGQVRSSAFIIRRPKTVAIQNCDFALIEGQAFSMTTRGAVIVKNNTFGTLGVGAFLDIKSDPESKFHRLNDVIFKNNTLTEFEEGSVMFDRTSFRIELDNVIVNQVCECGSIPIWKGNVLNYSRLYPGPTTVLGDEETVDFGPETFACLDEDLDRSPVTFGDYEGRNCTVGSSALVLALALLGCVLVLVGGGFFIVWWCKRQRERNQKRWISVPTNAPDLVSKKNGVIGREVGAGNNPVDSRITMVVPDGRVYRETEFHVIVEKAEPLTTEL